MGILRDHLASKQCRIASNYGLQSLRKERLTSELYQRFMNYPKETAGRKETKPESLHLLCRGSKHYWNVSSVEICSSRSLEINIPKQTHKPEKNYHTNSLAV